MPGKQKGQTEKIEMLLFLSFNVTISIWSQRCLGVKDYFSTKISKLVTSPWRSTLGMLCNQKVFSEWIDSDHNERNIQLDCDKYGQNQIHKEELVKQ